MSQLTILPAAKADLQDMWLYGFDHWGEKQADLYAQGIFDGCHLIIEHPLLGKALPEVDDALRVYPCQHHLIFYLADDQGVSFIAFLHERMDIVAHLSARF